MKKKFYIVFACIFFLSILNPNNIKVQAYSNNIIKPLWENTNYVDINAYINRSSIKIEATVDSNNISSNISGTMYLEKYTNGRWVNVTSWAFGGTGSVLLSRSYTATGGYQYRARISATVDGERVSATSNSVSL